MGNLLSSVGTSGAGLGILSSLTGGGGIGGAGGSSGGSSGGGSEGLLNSGAFNAGIGLLQANNAGPGQSSNPYAAISQGLQQTVQNRDNSRQRDRQRKLDEAIATIIENQARQSSQASPLQGGQQIPPVAGEQPLIQPVPPQAAPAQPPPQLPPPYPVGSAPVGATPGINPSAPSIGQIPPFTGTPATTSATGDLDEIGAALLQYGSPQQRAAVFSQMNANQRFNRGLAAEEAKFNARPGLQDPVHSTQILEDGRILQTHRSGKTSFSEIDGKHVRARNPLKVVKGPGSEVLGVNTRTGGVNELIGTNDAAARAAQTATFVQSAKYSQEQIQQGRSAYPVIRQRAQEALNVIQQLRDHPGRKAGTGLSSALPSLRGKSRDFDTLLDQAKGKVFLEAYQSLKGGGPITDREGQAAQEAAARLNEAQTEEEFLRALDELEQSIITGHDIAFDVAGYSNGNIDAETQELMRKYGLN